MGVAVEPARVHASTPTLPGITRRELNCNADICTSTEGRKDSGSGSARAGKRRGKRRKRRRKRSDKRIKAREEV